MKSIGETLLKPDLIPGVAQRLIAHVHRPQIENSLLLGRELIAFALRQRVENRLVVFPARLGSPLSLPPADACRDVETFIDDGEIAVVVQNPVITRVFGKYRHPEANIRLKLGRAWEVLDIRSPRHCSQREENGKDT